MIETRKNIILNENYDDFSNYNKIIYRYLSIIMYPIFMIFNPDNISSTVLR